VLVDVLAPDVLIEPDACDPVEALPTFVPLLVLPAPPGPLAPEPDDPPEEQPSPTRTAVKARSVARRCIVRGYTSERDGLR
jgi:hypothetical protein